MWTNSLMHIHSQAAQPYSNKHVIQNFLKPPSHLQIVPTYCTKQLREGGQRAATLICFAVGWAWQKEQQAGGRWGGKRGGSVGPYLGSSLSATPLCIWNALVLSRFFFFPKKKSMFLQTRQLNFWLCARILTCSLYWMETWLGQRVLRTGAAHCEPPWVSTLATTPALSKGLFTHGPCTSFPAEVRQGNKLLLCWQAQNPPVLTYYTVSAYLLQPLH